MLPMNELWRPRHPRLFRALVLANGSFAFLVVFVWALAAIVIADPISWATWAPVERTSQLSLINYPTNLLWMLPALALGAGWAARKGRHERLALGVMLMPVMFFALMIGSYHVLGLYNLR
jgi:hypothetical protein